jgi:hypothetical protein
MNLKRSALYFILPLCFAAYGCISLEQELFLNADGSGQISLCLSVPDILISISKEQISKQAGQDVTQSLEEIIAKIKAEAGKMLSPGVALKDVKEARQNGMSNLYIVLEFKDAESLDGLFKAYRSWAYRLWSELGLGSSFQIEKRKERTTLTGKLYFDSAKFFEGSKLTTSSLNQFEEQMNQLVLSMFRFRFALHAPAPITKTNADIVLNKRTAIWNLSMASFPKDKSPLQVKASY